MKNSKANMIQRDCTDIPFFGSKRSTLKIIDFGKNVEKLESSRTADGNVKWC